MFLAACLAGVGARGGMLQADVRQIIQQAVSRAETLGPPLSTQAVVAVTDREGWVLGVWSMNATLKGNDPLVGEAIAKAGTATFLSSDNNAFSTRTAGDIVQQHFPPGIDNTPPGPLVGVNFSQLAFSDINKYKGPGSVIGFDSSPGNAVVPVPLPVTGGLEGSPGGLPLFINGQLVGGVGVAGNGVPPTDVTPAVVSSPDSDEDMALAAQVGYAPPPAILGSQVFINGIRLEYAESSTVSGPLIPFASLPGGLVFPYSIISSPPEFAYPVAVFGGETGQIRQPIMNDPSTLPLPGNTARLTAAEVTNIIVAAANRARTTRAGIRLPRGLNAQVFITVVNNPGSNGVPPVVLGTFCTSSNATLFGWDVAVQKARTAVFFSSSSYAFSTRCVGFLGQEYYPPGIDNTQPGLFFGLQEQYSIITPVPELITNPVNNAVFTSFTNTDPNLPNGITIFPGGFPLYRNGVLIGAIGVSGDGVDQDDLISASGASLFLAPVPLRTDQFQYRGALLPFAKFPRNPGL